VNEDLYKVSNGEVLDRVGDKQKSASVHGEKDELGIFRVTASSH